MLAVVRHVVGYAHVAEPGGPGRDRSVGTGIAVMAALAVRFGDPQPVKVDVKTVAGPSVVQIISFVV